MKHWIGEAIAVIVIALLYSFLVLYIASFFGWRKLPPLTPCVLNIMERTKVTYTAVGSLHYPDDDNGRPHCTEIR